MGGLAGTVGLLGLLGATQLPAGNPILPNVLPPLFPPVVNVNPNPNTPPKKKKKPNKDYDCVCKCTPKKKGHKHSKSTPKAKAATPDKKKADNNKTDKKPAIQRTIISRISSELGNRFIVTPVK